VAVASVGWMLLETYKCKMKAIRKRRKKRKGKGRDKYRVRNQLRREQKQQTMHTFHYANMSTAHLSSSLSKSSRTA